MQTASNTLPGLAGARLGLRIPSGGRMRESIVGYVRLVGLQGSRRPRLVKGGRWVGLPARESQRMVEVNNQQLRNRRSRTAGTVASGSELQSNQNREVEGRQRNTGKFCMSRQRTLWKRKKVTLREKSECRCDN